MLSIACHSSIEHLVQEEVAGPLHMDDITFHGTDGLIPGYAANAETSHWDDYLIGAGGLRASINDLARWLLANLEPRHTKIGPALELAQEVHHDAGERMGLGWLHEGTILRHNGGTGGFHSFCGFERASGVGVAVLTNRFGGDATDAAALRFLSTGGTRTATRA